MSKRIYKSGSKWALWRWAESPLLYMKRLHLLHTPWGGVMLNFISRPDPWPDQHDHPVNFRSFILRGWYKEHRVALDIYGYYVRARKNIYLSPWFWITANLDWWRERFTVVSCVNRMVASYMVVHTIYECASNTLTLVFYGPRKREWGYRTPNGWVGWREYSQQKGE